MHDIEPFYHWRDHYIAAEDSNSPFHGAEYSEFSFDNRIYNYLIHPQWDAFGSSTLYVKVLYADYDEHFAILEFIGEWNDCLHNDIMTLKRNVIDKMIGAGISKFALICENVLNFHGSDECYYEEWLEDVIEEGGWIAFINTLDHVADEMVQTRLNAFVFIGGEFSAFDWRAQKPRTLIGQVDRIRETLVPSLH